MASGHKPCPIPRPPVATAISIDALQERNKVIMRRLRAIQTEKDDLESELGSNELKKRDLLREFDAQTR